MNVKVGMEGVVSPFCVGCGSATVAEVKRLVEEAEGIPCARQLLTFRGQLLENSHSLDACGVNHGDTLDLEVTMRVSVESQMHGSACVEVHATDTILSEKRKVDGAFVLAPPWQRLFRDAEELEDSKTVAQYNIVEGATLRLCVHPLKVELPSGGVRELDRIVPGDAVQTVKSQLDDIMPVAEQCLMHGDVELENSRTLASYDIPVGATLISCVAVNVTIDGGSPSMIRVAPTETIGHAVQQKLLPLVQQRPGEGWRLRLVSHGILLSEDSTFKETCIGHGARLKGLWMARVRVRTPAGDIEAVDVTRNDTFGSISDTVCKRRGLSKQRLYQKGKPLDETLKYNAPHDDDVLELPMSITVATGHDRITVQAPASYTVSMVKGLVNSKCGLNVAHMCAYHQGAHLEDHITLASTKVRDGSALVLVHRAKVRVRVARDVVHQLDVAPSDLPHRVKREIERLEGIPATQQMLRLRGTLLDDTRTLQQHGVAEGAELELSLRICVEMPRGQNPTEVGDCSPEETIETVMTMLISRMPHYARGQWRLACAGRPLKDARRASLRVPGSRRAATRQGRIALRPTRAGAACGSRPRRGRQGRDRTTGGDTCRLPGAATGHHSAQRRRDIGSCRHHDPNHAFAAGPRVPDGAVAAGCHTAARGRPGLHCCGSDQETPGARPRQRAAATHAGPAAAR